ncbi:molecular chaperone HtpG [Actinokineospora guangxiensis]|uniref:Chaperone protein HtpG n=1 Tax=Actinokineospora guangxiensis TaxID=1490288 RepID=A0ABW0EVG4_9PSEU
METLAFQSEARQLLQLMIHSVYSNKDTFLRELVSNSSDALDKLRLEAFRDKELDADTDNPRISIEVDRVERTLTVRDNGIGMTREDVVGLIGTIAKSGTAEFLKALKEREGTSSEDLIGQFGIGFYSTFMVADQVTLVTRHPRSAEGVRWESDGGGTYTIDTAADAPQGTSVTLKLKPADADDRMPDYADPATLRGIIKRYADFITWPITIVSQKPSEGDGEGEDSAEDEVVNSRKALWARPQSEVTEEEYAEFYRHVSHDWNKPLETISLKAEGTFEYQALLFIPSQAPMDLFMRERKRGVQLYVKRVFIMDDCEELMPEYLRFVKGVVDAADLSLNVSREILQQDRQIELMRRRLVKKVLATFKSMAADRQENYAVLWREFGAAIKEGLLSDTDNRDAILAVCSFASTNDAEKATTLAEYVERMHDGQDAIYYMTGDSRTAVENSPHLEALLAKGYEVLILTDPIDEMWVGAVPQFQGKAFQSVAKGEVDLGAEEDADTEQRDKDFADLLAWLTETLADQVREVRLTSRLTSSPACVVGDSFDLTPTLEKMYRAMGQELPQVKRILELNPQHPLVDGLRAALAEDRDRAELAPVAELLHGSALLAEGGDLPDPARFARTLAEHLRRGL